MSGSTAVDGRRQTRSGLVWPAVRGGGLHVSPIAPRAPRSLPLGVPIAQGARAGRPTRM
jgi:hypothetical protein